MTKDLAILIGPDAALADDRAVPRQAGREPEEGDGLGLSPKRDGIAPAMPSFCRSPARFVRAGLLFVELRVNLAAASRDGVRKMRQHAEELL